MDWWNKLLRNLILPFYISLEPALSDILHHLCSELQKDQSSGEKKEDNNKEKKIAEERVKKER